MFRIAHNWNWFKQRETRGLEEKGKPILQLHRFLVLYYYSYYICCHLYARYLQLYTWNKPCLYGTQCCSCSVFTVCATCNVISPVKYVLHFYISIFHILCAVHKMAVFCNTLISCFLGILLRYCLSDFEMVPVTLLLPLKLLLSHSTCTEFVL